MADGPSVGVIGAGIVGLATAHALRRGGARVTVYEAGRPGQGQSGGASRIFRHAHDDPRLITAARSSRAIWSEWEDEFGCELVSPDGVVAIGARVDARLGALREAGGIAVRPLEAHEMAAHMPLLAAYDGPAMLDELGGSIRTTAAIDALAGGLADALVFDEVITIEPTPRSTIAVLTGGRRDEHDRVVVCAGRGTAALARGLGLSVPVDLAAHVRLTFAVRHPPEHLACLQDSSGNFGEVGVYAAAEPGNRRYAVGLSQTTAVREDGALVDPAQLEALAERAASYVERALPGLDPRPLEWRHCWVTELPWGSDGFAAWQADDVLFVAGHNLFKLAPWLGRELAAAALAGEVPARLAPEARLGAA